MKILGIREGILVTLFIITVSFLNVSFAWTKGKVGVISQKKEKEEHLDIKTLTIDENISVPAVVSPFASKKIKEFMKNEKKRLLRVKNISVKDIRNGEVLKAVILMDNIFSPNDTVLNERSDLVLYPFLKYASTPDMFHILVVAHSDNTGSSEYNLNLTTKRAEAIATRIAKKFESKDFVVAYGMGEEEFVAPNNSMSGRIQNRRVDLYIIPGEVLIKQAERGKISF